MSLIDLQNEMQSITLRINQEQNEQDIQMWTKIANENKALMQAGGNSKQIKELPQLGIHLLFLRKYREVYVEIQ